MDFNFRNRPLSEYEREAMIIGGPEDGHEATAIMRFARIKRELLNSINSNKIKQEYVIKKLISWE
ncbi:MAG: hypothetical protein K5866_01020 [Treponema sp.]|nr:hypothetical protein [Treponema sp.]